MEGGGQTMEGLRHSLDTGAMAIINSTNRGPCIIQTSRQRKQVSLYYTSIQTSETWPFASSSTRYSLRITCYVLLLATCLMCEPYNKLPILVLIQLRKGFLDGLINRGAYM